MLAPVPIIDLLSTFGFLLSVFLAVIVKHRLIDSTTRFLLITMVSIYFLVSVSNVLEHGGITDYFDQFEDYLEILFLPLFLFFLYSFSINLELMKRTRAEAGLQKAHDSLEMKVAERTEKLSRANSELAAEIQERNRIARELAHQAFYDSLTGLPNRAFFLEQLQRAALLKKRNGDYKFAVLFCDVDRFKIINDSLGHLIGDQLLTMLARRLSKSIREVDIVSRLGGDEFAILLQDITKEDDAILIADRILKAFRATFNLSGKEIHTSMSIGIAHSNEHVIEHSDRILRNADIAMYNAKYQGKNCYAVFSPDMQVQVNNLLELESDLRRALKNQEFEIHYQPVVAIGESRVIGFEALLRWRHPEQGLLAPNHFIHIAEETDLIIPIGQWVMKTAFHHLRELCNQFSEYGDLTMSVNLSSREFNQKNFVQMVENILTESGLTGKQIRLEITERMIIIDPESARTTIEALKRLDVLVDIDDFGTGQSALYYLRHFPIDCLKIDQTFIGDLTGNPGNYSIVKNLISLAKDLGIDIVAEGIETQEQAHAFHEINGQYAQGFLYSRPVDYNTLNDILVNNGIFRASGSP